ncbi:MAG TPA: Flp family type IVb pilin [Gaiellaceae bacterium]|nr:Flp family type IVb pilin [Gaiellaceae bacterium]
MLESMYMQLQLAFAGLRPTARRREEGQALVEYALILSLVSIAAIGALRLTGTNILTILNQVANDL